MRNSIILAVQMDQDISRARRPISALSRSTIYCRIAEGTFPAPVALGRRTSAWPCPI
jgi:hypothetical protein